MIRITICARHEVSQSHPDFGATRLKFVCRKVKLSGSTGMVLSWVVMFEGCLLPGAVRADPEHDREHAVVASSNHDDRRVCAGKMKAGVGQQGPAWGSAFS